MKSINRLKRVLWKYSVTLDRVYKAINVTGIECFFPTYGFVSIIRDCDALHPMTFKRRVTLGSLIQVGKALNNLEQWLDERKKSYKIHDVTCFTLEEPLDCTIRETARAMNVKFIVLQSNIEKEIMDIVEHAVEGFGRA